MILLKNAIIKDYCVCTVKEESQKNEEMHEQGTDDRYSSVMPKKWGSSERVR